LGTAAEISTSLEDLRLINERFGGTQTTVELLRRVAAQSGCRKLSLLEVAAGAGDMIRSAQRQLATEGIDITPTLLDRMESHLHRSHATAVCADALRLPFRDEAFDVVSCSLFAHHLEPVDVRQFVKEGLRVCRRAVLINDLIRSRLHLWLIYAGMPSFRSRLTRHDAPASVRRAYTVKEMQSFLQDIPGTRVEVSKHRLYRMGVLVWKGSN
jgi:ubiquinone/menaquinone biosynthesis C-methylase UbiE